MFKNLLAKVGIGSASIDLILNRSAVRMGEVIEGRFHIKGGIVEQEINGIQVDLHVVSHYRKNDNLQQVDFVVNSVQLDYKKIISPEQVCIFDFQFRIPEIIPISCVNTKFYFKTNLDIESALDQKDKDYVEILPSGMYKTFLDGLNQLGCHIQTDYYDGRTQTLRLIATHWMAGKLDELEFKIDISSITQSIHGTCEIDKKTRGLLGAITDALDLDEYEGRFYFGENTLQNGGHAAYAIQQFIEEKYRRLLG